MGDLFKENQRSTEAGSNLWRLSSATICSKQSPLHGLAQDTIQSDLSLSPKTIFKTSLLNTGTARSPSRSYFKPNFPTSFP